MVDKKDLTTDDRITAAVQRSMPRAERPRLTTEIEIKLADTEHRSAAQYASMEEMARRLHDVADEIELTDGDLEEIDDRAIPEAIDFEDSLVQNIEIVRAQLKVSE